MSIVKGLIGYNDVSYGSGAFSRKSRTGFDIDIDKFSNLVDYLNGPLIDASRYSSFTAAITAAAGKTLLISVPISLPSGTISIPSNVSLLVLQSGSISKGSASSLNINGPVVGNPMHQWLVGFAAGEVTFEVGSVKTFHPIWVNYDLEITISAAPAGCVIELGNYASYSISNNWNINKAITVLGYFATITFPDATAVYRGIKVTSGNVGIYGLTIVGGGYAAAHYNRVGIHALGTSNANRLENIIIQDCKISNIVQGIKLEYVDHFNVENNRIVNVYNAGISAQTVANGDINKNYIDNVTESQSYGIAVTCTDTANDTVSKDVTIHNNIIKNVLTWHGIDTHGGKNLVVTDNVVNECKDGIMIGVLQRGSGLFEMPDNTIITGNNVINEVIALADTNIGVSIQGATKWTANFNYAIDDFECPTVFNGHIYKVTTDGGSSGATEPVWPTSSGGTVVDGGLTWTEVGVTTSEGTISNASVFNNNIKGFTRGIVGGYSDDMIISNNNISNYLYGIDFVNSCSNLNVSNNRLNSGSQSSTCVGIRFETAGDVWTGVCQNNTIIGDDYGIAVLETGIDVDVHFINNKINITSQYYHIDGLSNFTGRMAVTSGYRSEASATELDLGQSDDIILVTGTTSITSIATSSCIAGRKVTLIFADILTFTDGVNLKLAGNFVTTADDTITLSCDGTNWFEVCRSVN